jgi:hypothetical protein
MEKSKVWSWILIGSLLLNCYFIYHSCFSNPTIIEKIVEKPTEIVKVKTVWKTEQKPFTRPNNDTEALLFILETSRPELQLQPLYIYRDSEGNIDVPGYVGGTLRVGYLEWDLMAELDSEIEYQENPFGWRFGLLGLGYYDKGMNLTGDINLMLPVFGWNMGAGLRSVSLTRRIAAYDQTELDYGVGYLYNTAIVGVLGVSFHI